MEAWDLFDRNRNMLGKTILRGEPIPEGCYHLAVAVCVVNEEGKILLTYRDPAKKVFPCCWENPGGAAQAGDSSAGAAARELLEETGLEAPEAELVLLDSIWAGKGVLDVYLWQPKGEVGPILLQPGETCDYKWADLAELDRMLDEGEIAASIVPNMRKIWHVLEKVMR